MTAAALSRNALRPPRPRGMGIGSVLALAVHGLLLLALAFGVHWRSSEPAGVSAELWAAVPQVAAPAAVAPVALPKPVAIAPPKAEPKPQAPPPRDAEIAIEKAKVEKAKLEKAKVEQALADKTLREKKQREERETARAEAEATKRQQAAEQQRLDKQRDDNLKRLQSQADATGAPSSSGKDARDAGPSAGYAGRIVARVKPNIVFTDAISGKPTAEVEVRIAPDGTIIGRRLIKASGNKDWDEAVLRAIDRTEVLPRDIDGRVPATMTLVFYP